MNITSITSDMVQKPDAGLAQDTAGNTDPAKLTKVSRQFESILVRQFLGESMKPLLEDGPSGQVYGYLLTDSLANSISDGGGLGLANVIQAQLGKHK